MRFFVFFGVFLLVLGGVVFGVESSGGDFLVNGVFSGGGSVGVVGDFEVLGSSVGQFGVDNSSVGDLDVGVGVWYLWNLSNVSPFVESEVVVVAPLGVVGEFGGVEETVVSLEEIRSGRVLRYVLYGFGLLLVAVLVAFLALVRDLSRKFKKGKQ